MVRASPRQGERWEFESPRSDVTLLAERRGNMGSIKDCRCGRDHEQNFLIDVDVEDGMVEIPAICEIHKRHEPCRSCS